VSGQEHATRDTQHEVANPETPVANNQSPIAETFRKVTTFLERFARWRRLARQASLSRCLEAVLSETHYSAWLLTQPRGEQRQGNVQRLGRLAQQFDQFQRQGLFRFLRFMRRSNSLRVSRKQRRLQRNSVRLMSIHKSKGLEFPVVVVADLGKTFNESDLRAAIILDQEYGLCPKSSRQTPACATRACPIGWRASGSALNCWRRVALALRGHDARAGRSDPERQCDREKISSILAAGGNGILPRCSRPQLRRLARRLVFAAISGHGCGGS